ncbi:unnamed protein product [Linum trigynum]|uniref:Mitogen-activated protein kinase kinase kinase 1 n=1 Tax=Linum trigynum TaxID=586398 RepID=A0AAV2DHL8_9ROSI
MEEDLFSSTGSSSPPPPHPAYHRSRSRPTQPAAADRIYRALRHHLRLLHRSNSDFHVLGATGNVYTVSITAVPSCTCPDRISPCKHIFFVLIRVLGLSLDDPSLRRRNIRPCLLHRLLCTPSSPESLASPALRRTFHHLFQTRLRLQMAAEAEEDGGGDPANRRRSGVEVEEGATCPICLDEIVAKKTGEEEEEAEEGSFEACGTCGNLVHEECLRRWKRSRGRRGATCVICRSRWRARGHRRRRQDNDEYLNLGAYVSEDSSSTCGLVMGDSGGGRIFFAP